MAENITEQKISVYISLGIAGGLAGVDLIVNGSVAASETIILAFIGFAGFRQAAKSLLKR